jgi:hypothetical protein
MCTVPCIKGEREKTGEKDGDCLYHHKIVVVVCFVFVFLIREGMKKKQTATRDRTIPVELLARSRFG